MVGALCLFSYVRRPRGLRWIIYIDIFHSLARMSSPVFSLSNHIYDTDTTRTHSHTHSLSHRAVCVRTFIARQQSKKKSAEYAEQSTIERNREIDTHQNIFKACEWQLYRCVYSGSARLCKCKTKNKWEIFRGGICVRFVCIHWKPCARIWMCGTWNPTNRYPNGSVILILSRCSFAARWFGWAFIFGKSLPWQATKINTRISLGQIYTLTNQQRKFKREKLIRKLFERNG